MKKVEKVVVNFFLVVTLLLVKIEGIEFRSAAFQYGLDDIDGAFSSNSFDIKFKKTWLDEKAKGSDLPFMVLPENEVRIVKYKNIFFFLFPTLIVHYRPLGTTHLMISKML